MVEVLGGAHLRADATKSFDLRGGLLLRPGHRLAQRQFALLSRSPKLGAPGYIEDIETT